MLFLFMVDIETGSTTTSPYCLCSWYTYNRYMQYRVLYLFMVDIETGSTTTSPYCLGSWYTYNRYMESSDVIFVHGWYRDWIYHYLPILFRFMVYTNRYMEYSDVIFVHGWNRDWIYHYLPVLFGFMVYLHDVILVHGWDRDWIYHYLPVPRCHGILTTDTWNIVMLYLFMVDIENGSTTTSPYCLGSWYTYIRYMKYSDVIFVHGWYREWINHYLPVLFGFMVYLQQIHRI